MQSCLPVAGDTGVKAILYDANGSASVPELRPVSIFFRHNTQNSMEFCQILKIDSYDQNEIII